MKREKFLETEDYRICYRIVGTGKPVVLVHGFGEDGTIWNVLIDHLKSHFKCIIPDIPGSGRSQVKKGEWSMEAFAESVRAIIIHEEISSAVLIGHSMGGYISLAFAERYPELLEAFGLFHSSAFADNDEKKATRRRGIEFIQEHGAAKFLEQTTSKLFSDDFKTKNQQIIKEIIDRFTNFPDASLVHYYEAMMQRPDRTQVLRSFPRPILFVLGEQDTAIPLSDGLNQCHMPGLSYIHILRNSGHMGMIEETEKSGKILIKFLQELGIGDAGR